MNNSENYNQLVHEYSIWTSARASQRGFCSIKQIAIAINKSNLYSFSRQLMEDYDEDFISRHKKVCESLINELSHETRKGATWGRAAKIVNVYLKTAVVLPSRGTAPNDIHPPIDSRLLKQLKRLGIVESIPKAWSKMSEVEYDSVIESLKKDSRYEQLWMYDRLWKSYSAY